MGWRVLAKILGRGAWTSTSARGSAIGWGRNRGIVCHYPAAGKAIGVISQAQEASRLRGWRNYHVNGRGWADIGYNYAIGQSGRIWSLRGDRVGAHATGHNSTTVGVLFIVGDNEPLTKEAKAAFKALRAHLRGKGAKAGLWGHQQMSGASTRCPGPYIMADIKDGSLAAGSGGSTGGGGSAPAPKPEPKKKYESATAKHAVGSRVMGLYDGGTDVRWLQERLNKAGYSGGKVDGLYGPKLVAAVKKFQKDRGIGVDGLAGKQTINQIKSGRPRPKAKKPAFPLKSGHWFGVQSSNPKNHSGYWAADRPHIKTIQKAVGVKADGVYGPATRRAVVAWQKKKGLKADGYFGQKSWAKL